MKLLMSKNRRYLTIIGITLLFLALPIIMYVVGTRQDIRQRAAENVSLNPGFGKTCEVSDVDTLISCFGRLYYGNDQVDVIKFTAMVTCLEGDNCEVSVPGIRRPVLIYGDPGTEVGIKSTGTNSSHVFSITNSDNVDIKNIQIIGNGEPCPENRTCSNGLTIGDSTNIRIDNVTVRNAKRGIGVYYSDKVTITNSSITNNDQEGIHVHSATDTNLLTPTSGTVFIENNIISDNRRYGIFIEGIYPSISPSHISGNILDHNHTKTYPGYCISDTLTACGGGQIMIRNYTSNIVIENNIIRNGSLTTSIVDTGVSGIELGNRTIQNIKILSNDIHDNSFWGIMSFEITANLANNTIQSNRIYNNVKGTLLQTLSQQSNNCFESSCNSPLTTGSIMPATNFTSITSTGNCPTTLSWTSNASNAQVYSGETLLAETTNSSQLVSTITPGKTRFDFYGGAAKNTRLASTVVYCFASTSGIPSLSPSNAPAPSQLPITVTLTPGTTSVSLMLKLHGIGYAGDNASPGRDVFFTASQSAPSGSNDPKPPRTLARSATLRFYDNQNQLVYTLPVVLTFDGSTFTFTKTVTLPQVAEELITGIPLQLTISVPQYLTNRIPYVLLRKGQLNTLQTLALTTGNIYNDTTSNNLLDILDYNAIMNCRTDVDTVNKLGSCSAQADLDDDGNIDVKDYQLLIREFSAQRGN